MRNNFSIRRVRFPHTQLTNSILQPYFNQIDIAIMVHRLVTQAMVHPVRPISPATLVPIRTAPIRVCIRIFPPYPICIIMQLASKITTSIYTTMTSIRLATAIFMKVIQISMDTINSRSTMQWAVHLVPLRQLPPLTQPAALLLQP